MMPGSMGDLLRAAISLGSQMALSEAERIGAQCVSTQMPSNGTSL
jgi:hypothetical protein